ncbi:MAG: glucosaminidase domain-containing protein [Candidatus Levybacteria bacterium]|nr:glucosaminidase domain-containing protein [Candidatus Levybacteria bacterium]
MLKTIVFGLTLLFILIPASETPALAQTKLARPSASFSVEYTYERNTRAEALEAYLRKHNSPLAEKADIFVREADKNDLDWKFVAAISGVESTFGRAYPEGTYNAWGWGIYGTNMYGFPSWDEAIATISRELRERYMNQWGATDVYQIGRYYAASPTWASRVTYFMEQIEKFESIHTSSQLPISL